MVSKNSTKSPTLLRALLSCKSANSQSHVNEESPQSPSSVECECVQQSFDSLIRTHQFRSYSEFKSKLPDFFSLNHVKYKVVRCTPLPSDSFHKTSLVYRYMKYVCCSPNCASYFVLSKKQDKLWISQFNMIHSHPLLPANYTVMADLSDEFSKHFTQREFKSYAAAMKALDSFEEATGLSFVTGNSQKLKDSDELSSSLIYKRLLLICVFYESRYTKTFKTGCRASITFVSSNGVLKILSFNMKHNHLCGTGLTMSWRRRRYFDRSTLSYYESNNKYIGSDSRNNYQGDVTDSENFIMGPLITLDSGLLSVFNNSPILSFDRLCSCLKKFNEVTGSIYVYSHGVRLQPSDKKLAKVVYKNVAFVCVRGGSDKISCKDKLPF
uniref:Protein FAR1-RELATED SEQUENCE n=1 Tax=Mesocestoides corti TaxID=53468 RepID=A0A5K3ER10_MESCO